MHFVLLCICSFLCAVQIMHLLRVEWALMHDINNIALLLNIVIVLGHCIAC